MSDTYDYHQRWTNPEWQPKVWGGARIPRKLKKRLQGMGFYWYGARPECWPERWLKDTYTIPNLLPSLIRCKRYGWAWPESVVQACNAYLKEEGVPVTLVGPVW
jgi:hypothetical protein